LSELSISNVSGGAYFSFMESSIFIYERTPIPSSIRNEVIEDKNIDWTTGKELELSFLGFERLGGNAPMFNTGLYT